MLLLDNRRFHFIAVITVGMLKTVIACWDLIACSGRRWDDGACAVIVGIGAASGGVLGQSVCCGVLDVRLSGAGNSGVEVESGVVVVRCGLAGVVFSLGDVAECSFSCRWWWG